MDFTISHYKYKTSNSMVGKSMAIGVQMTTQLMSDLCHEHGTTDTHLLSCLEKEK